MVRLFLFFCIFQVKIFVLYRIWQQPLLSYMIVHYYIHNSYVILLLCIMLSVLLRVYYFNPDKLMSFINEVNLKRRTVVYLYLQLHNPCHVSGTYRRNYHQYIGRYINIVMVTCDFVFSL